MTLYQGSHVSYQPAPFEVAPTPALPTAPLSETKLMDARSLLLVPVAAMGVLGELAQIETQADIAHSAANHTAPEPRVDFSLGSDPTMWIMDQLGHMPLDAKAVAMAGSVLVAASLINTVQSARKAQAERISSRYYTGESFARRAVKKVGALALTGAAMYGAYKAGAEMDGFPAISADMGIMAGGFAVAAALRARAVRPLERIVRKRSR